MNTHCTLVCLNINRGATSLPLFAAFCSSEGVQLVVLNYTEILDSFFMGSSTVIIGVCFKILISFETNMMVRLRCDFFFSGIITNVFLCCEQTYHDPSRRGRPNGYHRAPGRVSPKNSSESAKFCSFSNTVTNLLLGGRKQCSACWSGTPAKAKENPTAAK